MAKKFTVDELGQIEEQFRALVDDAVWTCLFLDNSIALRKTLVNAVRKAGCEETLEAKDGMEALMLAKKAKAGKLAVVMEINNLPVIDGIAFLKQFRQLQEFKSCPVIIASTESKKPRIVEAIRAGANAYLKKPFDPQVLVDKLKELRVL